MCTGPSVGLRQLASHGKQVTLIRDMTDTMYDPRCWPYVSHFSGTDRIVDHIERFVCPTIASHEILGGREFRFAGDHRPTLAMLIAEDEYETEKTLPDFAAMHLGGLSIAVHLRSRWPAGRPARYRTTARADALLVSVRRRPLPTEQLKVVREFIASGKPVIGIRTASHAFCLRKQSTRIRPDRLAEFDAEVWGGNYTNHHGNEFQPKIYGVPEPSDTPLSQAVKDLKFVSGGSLYQVLPLAPGAHPLLMGEIAGKPAEPVAWTIRTRQRWPRVLYVAWPQA